MTSQQVRDFCDGRETSYEIGVEILELAEDDDHAQRIWAEPTDEEDRLIIGRAFGKTDETELFWGQSRLSLQNSMTVRADGKAYPVLLTNEHGREIDAGAAFALMDDGVRERLHGDIAPCSPAEFFRAYCAAHRERFGEEFEPNKPA